MRLGFFRLSRLRWLAAAILAGSLGFATPAMAADKVVKGWLIMDRTAETDCTMVSEFESGTSIMIIWNPRTEVTIFAIFNNSWDTLRERVNQKVPLKLTFRGNVEYDEWTDSEAIIVTTDEGSEGVVGTWGQEHQLDLAVTIMAGQGVKIEADNRVIGNFNLSGTREAILALRRCGGRVMKKGGDPFAN